MAVSYVWKANYHYEIGGKLIGSQKQMHVLAGIVSRTDGTANPDYAGVRTAISNNDAAPTGSTLVIDNVASSTAGFGFS
jgi:hypothetical protein